MGDRRREHCLVVGYDGSETSRWAVEQAAQRVGREGKVVVVYATGPPPELFGKLDVQRLTRQHEQRGRAELDALMLEAPDAVLEADVELVLADGPPAKAIVRAAEEHDADAIVVGSRGLGAARTALGSVSNEVLHLADRPVLVIPEGATVAHG